MYFKLETWSGLRARLLELYVHFTLYNTCTFYSTSAYICCCLVAQLCPALCNPMDWDTPDFPVLHHLPELAQTHVHQVVMPSNHLILWQPLLFLPSVFPSIRVFSNELAPCIRWPKYWRFRVSPSKEYSGLISFRIDRFDLFEVQGTLKSFLQHHSSKASLLQCSALFMI